MSFSMSGIASGLNTASMIDQLMQIERIPYNKLETKKKNLQTSQELFRTLNTKMNALKTAAADLTYGSNFNISSAKSSDESAVRVSGSSSAATGNYNVVVKNTAKSHVIKSTALQSDLKMDTAGKEVSIGDKTYKLDELSGKNNAELLENLKNAINKDANGVSASVVETETGSKTLVLTSVQTGKDNMFYNEEVAPGTSKGIKLTGFDILGITGDLSMAPTDNSSVVQKADDASITVNGLEITSASNEIKGVIDGVTITALKDNSSSMITVQKDTNQVYENVKKFVDSYNEVRKLIRDNTAKGQPMQGDSMLRQLDMEMSKWVTGFVGEDSDTGSVLADIGIEMDKGKKGSEMDGQLVLDEAKFKAAFEKDPQKVVELFNFTGIESDDGNGNKIYKHRGIAKFISDEIQVWTNSTNGIINSRIKGYDSEISFVDDSMENMLIRLGMKEQQLKRQFTAMEVAMGKLKNEGDWLSSQLSGLSKSKG